MKQLYLDCSMGAAGDMLMAALLELTPDPDGFLETMNRLGLPGVQVTAEPAETCGVTGLHLHVLVHGREEGAHDHEHAHDHVHMHDHEHEHEHAHEAHCGHDHPHAHDHVHMHDHDHEHEHEHEHAHLHDHDHDHTHDHGAHHHSRLHDILACIDGLDLPAQVKADARAVYRRIAEAEGQVHGQEMEQIHFHEVGTMDAVTDVVGVCLLFHQIGAARITASPVHVGSGTVQCAHGVLPVPAPATALLLRGIPVYGGEIRGELCTPTGAALLAHFVQDFGPVPPMTIEAVGYGIGTKEFPRANCVRAMLGEVGTASGQAGDVTELAANLDDMTAEEIGFAMERLLEAGALDVYAAPIVMKKSRPATKLVCLCRPAEAETFADLMLRHTTTAGVRAYQCSRVVMTRHFAQQETPWGPVTVKVCERNGVTKAKAEFEDLAAIARDNGLSLREVKDKIHE